MNFIYPFFISFILIFFSELGDKTQLLVLSFSTKGKAKNILLGVALGTFFSHGLAILFGSKLGSFENEAFSYYSKIFTYFSFLLFGIIGIIKMLSKKISYKTTNKDTYKKSLNGESSSKKSFLQQIINLKINYVFIIAICILIGELGDKTFLASLGLGLEYPRYKLSLILGSITGMVASNSIALFFGKLLGSKLKPSFIELLSNIIFILFGLIGFYSYF